MARNNKEQPFLFLKNDVLFPNFTIRINFEKNNFTKEEAKTFFKNKKNILVIPTKEANSDEVLNSFAVLAEIIDITKESGEIVSLTVLGKKRVKILKLNPNIKKLASYEELIELNEDSELINNIKSNIEKFLTNNKNSEKINLFKDPLFTSTNSIFSDALIMSFGFTFDEKFDHLKELDVEKRFRNILNILNKKFEFATKVANEVDSKVREKLGKQQKEFYLREQLKVIKEELEILSGQENEVKEIIKKANSNPYPKEIKEKIIKEAKRLEATPSSAPESSVIRNYLDWLMNVPWWQKSEEMIDVKNARKVLDKNHYGLEKTKDRIVEYLSVKQINKDFKGMIVTFVGPPGTGKTSFAKSISDALNRKFIKISLGGVKDESEIRGHRRTYIASMPGKIIQAMKKSQVVNPIILLDEIDKMSSDFRGDPSSALLEVLDYEQNNKFQDHYLEEEYDLSNVLFIATANYIRDIPEPLLDRLEVIELSSYTELEKVRISKSHLIPKILKETSLNEKLFQIDDESIKYLIRHYTMEAGVRELYRILENLTRKIIVLKLSGKIKLSYKLNDDKINKLLGPIKYDFTKKMKKSEPGVVNGLAWTAYGGDILPIEVSLYPGKGNINITGQLKDVMKESSEIALSYVKTKTKDFKIPLEIDEKKLFEEYDFHIHSPDGATPKDGPSAGVTFTTAIISALKNKPISSNVGMTGEITLKGNVLPIGGLKEKLISAYRSSLKLIFIPKENEKDLIDIPTEVKDNLKIISVKKYDDIYNYLEKNEKNLWS